MEIKNKKIKEFWEGFILKNPEYKNREVTDVYHFWCDRECANELAELVANKVKQATTSLYYLYEKENAKLPKEGDISIITDFDGNPVTIIENMKVELTTFNKVTLEYAEIEGEGDKSLEYWKKVHKEMFTKELLEFDMIFNENMKVVCEYFKTIYVLK